MKVCGLPLALDEHGEGAGLDDEHDEGAAEGHQSNRGHEGRERDRRIEEGGNDQIGRGPRRFAQHAADVSAHQDGDHQGAADNRHTQRHLVERLDGKFDEDDRPVGKRDEGAVPECGAQRKRRGHDVGARRPRSSCEYSIRFWYPQRDALPAVLIGGLYVRSIPRRHRRSVARAGRDWCELGARALRPLSGRDRRATAARSAAPVPLAGRTGRRPGTPRRGRQGHHRSVGWARSASATVLAPDSLHVAVGDQRAVGDPLCAGGPRGRVPDCRLERRTRRQSHPDAGSVDRPAGAVRGAGDRRAESGLRSADRDRRAPRGGRRGRSAVCRPACRRRRRPALSARDVVRAGGSDAGVRRYRRPASRAGSLLDSHEFRRAGCRDPILACAARRAARGVSPPRDRRGQLSARGRGPVGDGAAGRAPATRSHGP